MKMTNDDDIDGAVKTSSLPGEAVEGVGVDVPDLVVVQGQPHHLRAGSTFLMSLAPSRAFFLLQCMYIVWKACCSFEFVQSK